MKKLEWRGRMYENVCLGWGGGGGGLGGGGGGYVELGTASQTAHNV